MTQHPIARFARATRDVQRKARMFLHTLNSIAPENSGSFYPFPPPGRDEPITWQMRFASASNGTE